jgi:hypothetical protein
MNVEEENKVVFTQWCDPERPEYINPNAYLITRMDEIISARKLLKRIKNSALELGYEDFTHGFRECAIEHLQLKTKDGKDFITIELRRAIRFPFRLYLKAFNDGMDKNEFEHNLKTILDNVK